MVEYSFDHIHYYCSDVDAMAKFLVNNFGGTQVFRNPSGESFIIGVRVSGEMLLLSGARPDAQTEKEPARYRGLHHLGLQVKDLDAAYEELTAKGVQFTRPPTSTGSVRFAYVLGPDSIAIELLQRS